VWCITFKTFQMVAETFGVYEVDLIAFSFQIWKDLRQVFQEFIRVFCIFGGIPGFIDIGRTNACATPFLKNPGQGTLLDMSFNMP
jgi:hypothetical protein